MKKTIILTLSLLSINLFAKAETWTIDSKHATANFAVAHMIVGEVSGFFTGVTGTLTWDGANLKAAKLEGSIDANSITTSGHDATDRDKHLKGSDFFETEKFPTIKFASTSFTKDGDKLSAKGKLTMHGKEKEVLLTNVKVADPVLGRSFFSAQTEINRKDFGISYGKVLDNGGLAIGETVSISLKFELIKPEVKK